MMKRRLAMALVLIALPITVAAQTLPQSTQDRQEIANLEFQATLPGTTAATRAEIQQRISQLQYQINTRPAIEPMPTLAPTWNAAPQTAMRPGSLPQLSARSVPMTPAIYGSCDMDRAVVSYLTEQLTLPSTTEQERAWDRQRIGDLRRRMKASNC